jgi:hypothetical protein
VIVRTRGYRPLLACTVLLTAAAVAVVVLGTADLPPGWSPHRRIAIALLSFVLAGLTCTVRKRFSTRTDN